MSPRSIACAVLLAAIAVAPVADAATAPASTAPASTVPAALVESVSAPVAGITPFGYLQPGASFDLGVSTTLVVDYLSQCVRETITGGQVTIGADQSQVHGGHLSRRRLDCDGGDLQIAASQAEQGAVVEYRAVGDAAALVVHSTAPLILPAGGGQLAIERLDTAAAVITIDVAADAASPRPIDIAALGHALAPGGKYRITLGQRSLVFSVDPAAAGATAPLLARMLPI